MTVTDDAAVVVNFTLTASSLEVWSNLQDFGIEENLNTEDYMLYEEVKQFISDSVSENPNIASSKVLGQTSSGEDIDLLELSAEVQGLQDDQKLHVALIGGLNGDEPIGGEIIVRFARHLIEGKST